MLDLYRMIVPEKGTFPEYETFYTLYSQNIKMNMISFQLFDEAKEKLPNIMLSFSKDVEYKEKEIDSDLLLIGAKREKSCSKHGEPPLRFTQVVFACGGRIIQDICFLSIDMVR